MRTLLVIMSVFLAELAEARLLYSIKADIKNGATIVNPSQCSDDIGAGGNLVDGGVRYAGKCVNGGRPVEFLKTSNIRANRALKFVSTGAIEGTDNTRTELAILPYLPFHQRFYIGFRLRIPENVSSTDEFFSLLQLWQCGGGSPIAGIRVNRGTSHSLNFMTRGDMQSASFAHAELTPGKFSSFVFMVNVNPIQGGNGEVGLWIDGHHVASKDVAFGFTNSQACEGAPPQHFRIKFGIYKTPERGRHHEVHFDDINVGTTFKEVAPWY